MGAATAEKEITNPSKRSADLRKCVGENLEAKSDYFSATPRFKMTRRPEKEKHFAAATAEAQELRGRKKQRSGRKTKQ